MPASMIQSHHEARPPSWHASVEHKGGLFNRLQGELERGNQPREVAGPGHGVEVAGWRA